LAEGLQLGLVLPRVEETRRDRVEYRVESLLPLSVSCRCVGGQRQNSSALQPLAGDGAFSGRDGVQKMTVKFGDSQLVEILNQGQEARLVGRHIGVRRANQEGLISFIAATVNQIGSFGVSAGDDDPGSAHKSGVEAGGVRPFFLLVLRHKLFAALMAPFLGARTLVLGVVAGTAGSRKGGDGVARVGAPAVASVGAGDDE